tara:strand:- start:374 stop:511 length:138 start_codon:yes stop_codon:yes gene_type:complete
MNEFEILSLSGALAVFGITLLFFGLGNDDDDDSGGMMRPVRQKVE